MSTAEVKPSTLPKFWMVWCPHRSGPTYQHPSKAAARKEAERLARSSPGLVFIVLAAVDARVCSVSEPHVVKLTAPVAADPDDGIPF